MRWIPFLSAFLLSATPLWAKDVVPTKTVTFPSADKLVITADLYIAHKDSKTPFIVLFHQARWSRGEYREIAPKLVAMGFNCMAVDQRSGKEVNGVPNATFGRAQEAGKPVAYLDARPDLVAALEWARKKHAKGKLLAWGSSYSSALVLEVVGSSPKLADGVLSFAPGEYFAREKGRTFIRDAAKNLKCPVFITSAKREKPNWAAILEVIPSKAKVGFVPETQGQHGSRALWEQFPDSDAYWTAVTAFLKKNFLPKKK